MSDTADGVPWLNAAEHETWLHFRQLLWQFPAALDRQLMRDSGLSTGEYSVLAALSEETTGILRAGELAGELGWERSRLSHLVRRMEAKGLVARQASDCDGRGLDLVLTGAGRAAIEAAAPHHVRFVRSALFDVLDEEEVLVLGDMLKRIGDAACDSVPPEPC